MSIATPGARLFVVSAPSGAGKSTLTQAIVTKHPQVKLSISCTTRRRRGDEQDGREYHFLSETEFFRRIESGDFLEWAQVHGHYYGTSRQFVQNMLDQGQRVIFDIDVQGAAKLKEHYPDAVLIFVAPPSRAELERRLRERKTDDPKEIAKRLGNAAGEIYQARQYDYIVINDRLDTATAQLESVVFGRPAPEIEKPEAVIARLLTEYADDQTTI